MDTDSQRSVFQVLTGLDVILNFSDRVTKNALCGRHRGPQYIRYKPRVSAQYCNENATQLKLFVEWNWPGIDGRVSMRRTIESLLFYDEE